MDNPNRKSGGGSSKGSSFLSSGNNSMARSNQHSAQRYQSGSASYSQSYQASPNASDQQRMLLQQELHLRQLRQNHMQQHMQQQMPSSSLNQHQQEKQNQEQQRRLAQLSPNALLMASSPLGSPNYTGQLLGSPTSQSINGQGSLSSLKSVFGQFQQQKRQPLGSQLPPAPPLVAAPSATTVASATKEGLPKKSGTGSSTTHVDTQTTSAHNSSNKRASVSALPPLGYDEAADLIKKCDWVDKTMWVARQLLGGQSVNGFLRATSAVQRIKKQRARQNQKGKVSTGEQSKKRGSESLEQEEEEILKKEIMNARTAKKMKTELDLGIHFCRLVHATVRSILQEMDPTLPLVGKLAPDSPKPKGSNHKLSGLSSNNLTDLNKSAQRMSMDLSSNNNVSQHSHGADVSSPNAQEVYGSTSPGNPSGSTLRKNRKKKLPPNEEQTIDLPEFDITGKRLCTKKEHLYRLSECIRYRALRQGDVVAARVSSRNLWIVARVLKDYPSADMSLLDFVRLSDLKREQLFKEKVHIRDVEDKQNDSDANFKVARSLVLPLPRSFSEAAEWAQRFKKGSRVYALYPDTTALYTATVLDSTTYARDDDDIIVVRFDGDEPDSSGSIPACHIPARFVTLIPRGLSGAQSSSGVSSSTELNSKKKAGTDIAAGSAYAFPPPSDHDMNLASNLDEIDLDEPLPGLDAFDDLDFDLLGE